jgi:hypothetical protein
MYVYSYMYVYVSISVIGFKIYIHIHTYTYSMWIYVYTGIFAKHVYCSIFGPYTVIYDIQFHIRAYTDMQVHRCSCLIGWPDNSGVYQCLTH